MSRKIVSSVRGAVSNPYGKGMPDIPESDDDFLAYCRELKRRELVCCGVIDPNDPLPEDKLARKDLDKIDIEKHTIHSGNPIREPEIPEELVDAEEALRKRIRELHKDSNVAYVDFDSGLVQRWREKVMRSKNPYRN